MEHTFKIYYQEEVYKLESFVKNMGAIGIPMNRAGIYMDKYSNEIRTLNLDPFNQEYHGLQISFQFKNTERKWNEILSTDVIGLENDFEYSQGCFLSFNNSYQKQINIDQITVMESVFNSIAAKSQYLLYGNGHFKYKIEREDLCSKKQQLVEQIINWNK